MDLLKSGLGQFCFDETAPIKIIGRSQSSSKSDGEKVIEQRLSTPAAAYPTYASSAPVAIAASTVSLLVIFSYHMGQWQQQRMQPLISGASSC